MTYLTRGLLLLSLSLLGSCENKSEKFNSKILKIDPFDRDTVAVNFVIKAMIPLESKDKLTLVSPLQFIELVENKFYVLDGFRGFYYIFNKDGTLFKQVGKLGQGPGEFTKVFDLDWNPIDSVFILFAHNDRKIQRYTVEGELIDETKINFFAKEIALIRTGIIISVDYNTSKWNNSSNLLIADKNYNIEKYFFKYIDENRPSTDFSGFLVTINEGALFANSLEDTIYHITPTEVSVKYIVDFGAFKAPQIIKEDISQFHKMIDYSYLNKPAYENDEFVILPFTHKRYLQKMIYNKATRKVHIDRDMDDPIFQLLSVPLNNLSSKELISEISYETWYFFDENKKSTINIKYPDLAKQLQSLSEGSNPLIIIYEIGFDN